jgi:hypothetical protein
MQVPKKKTKPKKSSKSKKNDQYGWSADPRLAKAVCENCSSHDAGGMTLAELRKAVVSAKILTADVADAWSRVQICRFVTRYVWKEHADLWKKG